MKLCEEENTVKIYDLLYRLGAAATHTGFFHTAYAVRLAAEQPERLLLVTKWLYPDVAKHYGTNWRAVERNIRTTIQEIWKRCPETLSDMAGYPMTQAPRPAEFISILARHISVIGAA